jgi:hypothetical protein
MKKLLLLSIFVVTISCQKSSTQVNPMENCYMTKLTLTTKTTVPVKSVSESYNIEYNTNQKISKISNAYSLVEYIYSPGKVIIKSYDVANNKNTLKTTNTTTLNNKEQVVQISLEDEVNKKIPNYTPYVLDYEYNDKGFISKNVIQKVPISSNYEFNSVGLPSKITNNYVLNGQVIINRYFLHEYYDEYKPVDFPNLERLYDYKSIGGLNKVPYTKLIKSVKYYEQNILKKESNFTYTTFSDNKKIKSITQIDYNYTSGGVKVNTPTTTIQEFEYQCK